MRFKNVELHNVCDLIENDGGPGFGVLRMPRSVLAEVNPGAQKMARMGTGCEIRGLLPEGGQAKIVLQVLDDNSVPAVATVFHGCFCAQSVLVRKEPTEIIIKTPDKIGMMSELSKAGRHAFDPRLVRVRLPAIHTPRILSIEGDLSYPGPAQLPRRTLLCYGSSITHGACATPPEGTYAAQCARRLGVDLINLGVGGSAQMDPAIAGHIASRTDWDMAVFEMGINVRTWPREKFQPIVEHFVRTVATAHPAKLIFCIDLFTYDGDYETPVTKAVGFREAITEVAGQYPSGKVIPVDGRTILTDPTGLRTDLVHPSDDGMQEMGANLARVIARYAV
jgi:lysophospholipase L1-like esterase